MGRAADPAAWLDWLRTAGTGDIARRFVTLRVYLNPGGSIETEPDGLFAADGLHPKAYYSRFRQMLVWAGFEVIDCPRLTRAKNGGDIRIVIDVLDALAGPVPPAAVRSTGVEPVLRAGPLVDAVADLLAEVGGTVGVVCPRELVEQVRAQLPPSPRLQVLDTWQAKGLEFDGCAVLAPERIVAEARTSAAGLRTLYVALTRATQRLTVVSDEPLDWLLPVDGGRHGAVPV